MLLFFPAYDLLSEQIPLNYRSSSTTISREYISRSVAKCSTIFQVVLGNGEDMDKKKTQLVTVGFKFVFLVQGN